MQQIVVGSDHVGLPLKEYLKDLLREKGYAVIDVGTQDAQRTDYPVSGFRAAKLVAEGKAEMGLLICGTGVGISLAANKVHGIRACVCSEPYTARLARQHNNANMLAMGARVVGPELAKMILEEFLTAQYEGGRHQVRIDMLAEIEAAGRLAAAEA